MKTLIISGNIIHLSHLPAGVSFQGYANIAINPDLSMIQKKCFSTIAAIDDSAMSIITEK